MDEFILGVLLRSAGGILLMAVGIGSGQTLCGALHRDWWELHTLALLLKYWEGMLEYQALTARELVRRACSNPEFRQWGLQETMELEALPIPKALPDPAAAEVRQGLRGLAQEPRQTACHSLHRLAVLCEQEAEKKQKEVESARVLWPRIGGCLGILAAILLW